MFAYPKQAEVNREVPKVKLYAHGKVTKRIKDFFVTQVDEIRWRYKLSPETINLPARDGIEEIEVFELVLKTPHLADAVLQTIDRAIPLPLVYQLTYGNEVRFAATYKRPSEADPEKWVIEDRFVTAPLPKTSLELQPLPVALDLAVLYEQIIRRHMPLPARTGESLADQVTRLHALEAVQKQHRHLETRLAQEKQFNRKVELNAALRSLTQELEALKRG
ncbi:hypothetical protein D3C72_132240 [compost metagenome]